MSGGDRAQNGTPLGQPSPAGWWVARRDRRFPRTETLGKWNWMRCWLGVGVLLARSSVGFRIRADRGRPGVQGQGQSEPLRLIPPHLARFGVR